MSENCAIINSPFRKTLNLLSYDLPLSVIVIAICHWRKVQKILHFNNSIRINLFPSPILKYLEYSRLFHKNIKPFFSKNETNQHLQSQRLEPSSFLILDF